MTTANDIIVLAMKESGVLGVGQTASAEDLSDNLKRLNFMLAQWARKRWLVWHLIATSVTSTGAQSYTVGPGQDFDIVRPDRLEDAYFRQILPSGQNQVDYPLELIEAREDYDRISLKSLKSWPTYCFYDSGFPTGSVYFWPIPAASLYEMFIVTKAPVTVMESGAQEFVLPPEYEAALLYNLAVRMRPAYQLPPDPSLVSLATDALNVLRTANAQVPRLTMPTQLARGGLYNIYSDRIY
jgi:hypothetical protein